VVSVEDLVVAVAILVAVVAQEEDVDVATLASTTINAAMVVLVVAVTRIVATLAIQNPCAKSASRAVTLLIVAGIVLRKIMFLKKSMRGTAVNSYTVDNNWYTDTGVTDHITGELDKLAVREMYNGTDQIHAASGSSMN
jgi:hypothetical protein